ncbi:M28 family peptidase [Porphyromonas sp.]|uniref:M28 family peptidase n=1 Tax=Porphyromonas sp. TaxID=1924944 RepID=UPI0026DC099E|nr:M28 family peptidase [Porphyromonas sp.]MDO4771118.1 M28 family peptidase [Porphyromonas sp.]
MKILYTLILMAAVAACGGQKKTAGSDTGSQQSQETASIAPSPFSADSAYLNIQKQVDFGPRVPNMPSHRACADFLAASLERQGLQLHVQNIKVKAYDGAILDARNIIGVHNPDAKRRILLFAHWDTRPMADHDGDKSKRHQPIDGADDGGSGTGVLLEIARLLKQYPMKNIGIDIALFDAEDYGAPEEANYQGESTETWALGTQKWTREPHVPGYHADFGILLDMVGSKDARFYREYFSQESAGRMVTQIWDTAKRLGYNKYFINEMGGAVTDDHYFVIRNLGIPCVDIINFDPDSRNGFGHYWHTHKDNMSIIDRETLKAVGETVWQVLLDYDNTVK